MNGRKYRPEWLRKQKGLRYKTERAKLQSRFMAKFKIVSRFTTELERAGWRVTHEDVRAMLVYLRRGYKTDAQSISRLIHTVGGTAHREKYSNGHRIEVLCGGTQRAFRSLNEAARAEGCSPESIRNWASSGTRNRRGQVWRFIDPEHLRT